MKFKVSIISINYNTHQLTLDFIDSVIAHTTKDILLEFIIIDNCSEIDDFEKLQNNLFLLNNDTIRLIRSKINLGFGGGNMFGVQYATGDYLAFINNDILFTEDCFSSLISFLKENVKAAVCTPQQLNQAGKPTSGIDYFHGLRKELLGRSFLELFFSKNKIKRKSFPYQQISEADFIQGCFMFFDKEKFCEVGGFDTNLFLYYEEMDICYRLKQKGYKSYLVPETSFKHLHGGSTSKSFVIKKELLLSRLYIYRKNYSYIKYKLLQSIVALKLLFSFKNIRLFYVIVTGAHLKHSLKQKQVIVDKV